MHLKIDNIYLFYYKFLLCMRMKYKVSKFKVNTEK